MGRTHYLTTIALLSAVGVVLFVIESIVPIPIPFIKLGFANISGLLALYFLGPSALLAVVLIRVVVGSILVGTIFGPAFLLSMSGGVASALAMILLTRYFSGLFSVIGISIVGSVTHMLTQLALVSSLFLHDHSAFALLPILLTVGLVSGTLVGWITAQIIRFIRSNSLIS